MEALAPRRMSRSAKLLYVHTMKQFHSLMDNKRLPKTQKSFRAIDRWYNPDDGCQAPTCLGLQPSHNAFATLCKWNGVGTFSVEHLLALRQWMAQFNTYLHTDLQEDDWGVPGWYYAGVSEGLVNDAPTCEADMQLECDEGGELGAAAPASPPRRCARSVSSHTAVPSQRFAGLHCCVPQTLAQTSRPCASGHSRVCCHTGTQRTGQRRVYGR